MAVEDELVLAADEVAERQVGGVVARPGDQHLLAVLGLADVERRGGEVDDQLRTGEGEIRRRRAGLPDVLADRGADEHVAAAEQHELSAGGEVAVLVEDAVVRKEVLAVDASQLPVSEHGACVCEVAIEERAADERGDPLRRGGDLVERGAGGLDEARAEEQVLGRIPCDRELGEDDEVGSGGAGLTDRIDDQRAVAGKIADDGVELREREPHRKPPCF